MAIETYLRLQYDSWHQQAWYHLHWCLIDRACPIGGSVASMIAAVAVHVTASLVVVDAAVVFEVDQENYS